MSENMNRDWRRKRRQRGVSPIIATILLVAITVVLAAVLYILISGLTKGPGNTPLGTALAVAPPKEAAVATNHWYNFSVQSASSGLTMGSMNFQIQTTGAGVVTPLGAWTVNVDGISGASIAVYAMTTGTWTSGSTTALSSGEVLSFDVVQATGVSGDNLVISGAGSYQGTISVAIP